MNTTDNANPLLQALAWEFATSAIEALEPLAGSPIGPDVRERLAAGVFNALLESLPPLVNMLAALAAVYGHLQATDKKLP